MRLVLILLLLTGCSVQKKCEWHIKKATKQGCLTLTNDTIINYDTLIGYRIDTVFNGFKEVDTFTLTKDNIITTTIVRWRLKEVSQSQIKKDTIIKNIQIIKKQTQIIESKKLPLLVKLIIGAMGLIILLLALKK